MAIALPILVLVYCNYRFKLDRAVVRLNMEFCPPGSFACNARMVTDPAQIALFRLVFDSLRIQTPLDSFLRVSLNLSLCYQFSTLISLFAQERERMRRDSNSSSSARKSFETLSRRYAAVALLFVVASGALFAATISALATSHTLCSPHPECVTYAHRLACSSCACIAFIDVDMVPN